MEGQRKPVFVKTVYGNVLSKELQTWKSLYKKNYEILSGWGIRENFMALFF